MLLSHLPNLPVTPGPCPPTTPWSPTIPVLILHGAVNASTCSLNHPPSHHPPRPSLQSASLAILHCQTVQTTFCVSQTTTSRKDNSLLRSTYYNHFIRMVRRAIQKPRTSNLMAGRWLCPHFRKDPSPYLSSLLERTQNCLAPSPETRVLPFRLDASISATRKIKRGRKEGRTRKKPSFSFAIIPSATSHQLDWARNNKLEWRKEECATRVSQLGLHPPTLSLSLIQSLPLFLSLSKSIPITNSFKTLLFLSSCNHYQQNLYFLSFSIDYCHKHYSSYNILSFYSFRFGQTSKSFPFYFGLSSSAVLRLFRPVSL